MRWKRKFINLMWFIFPQYDASAFWIKGESSNPRLLTPFSYPTSKQTFSIKKGNEFLIKRGIAAWLRGRMGRKRGQLWSLFNSLLEFRSKRTLFRFQFFAHPAIKSNCRPIQILIIPSSPQRRDWLHQRHFALHQQPICLSPIEKGWATYLNRASE